MKRYRIEGCSDPECGCSYHVVESGWGDYMSVEEVSPILGALVRAAKYAEASACDGCPKWMQCNPDAGRTNTYEHCFVSSLRNALKLVEGEVDGSS